MSILQTYQLTPAEFRALPYETQTDLIRNWRELNRIAAIESNRSYWGTPESRADLEAEERANEWMVAHAGYPEEMF